MMSETQDFRSDCYENSTVTVLVVDDDPSDRRLAGSLLEQHACLTTYASSVHEAMGAVRTTQPDVVVTDLHMPEADGLELVAAIQAEAPEIPVILMTGHGSAEIAVQALNAGAASYVSKSRLQDRLVPTVKDVYRAVADRRCRCDLIRGLVRHEQEYEIETHPHTAVLLAQHLERQVSFIWSAHGYHAMHFIVALQEALSNAVFHGNLELSSELREGDSPQYWDLAGARLHEPPYRDRRVYVHSKISPQAAEFRIRDEGPGFDVTSVADPTDPDRLELCSGRGLLLMRAFMDDVRFSDRGNEVTLSKRSSNGDPIAEASTF